MGVSDFDENGNRMHLFPSGLDKIKAALGIVPPTLIYFTGPTRPGSILEALKEPNKDVDFATIERDEMLRQYRCADEYAKFSKGVQLNPPVPYTGPDMNEVDAALEAIERMGE